MQHQFQNQEILYHKDTPYGKIAVTKFADQINFYDNGVFQFSDDNIITSEEGVHYGMIQHPAPKHVLLISGGASGMIQEILKYDIESLDYVEQNPAEASIATTKQILPGELNRSRLCILNKTSSFLYSIVSFKPHTLYSPFSDRPGAFKNPGPFAIK